MTYELGHEGNHEVEETNSLDEGKTQDGVREELTTEGRVASNSVEEGGEDETDTDTGTSQTNGGRAHTQVLGDLDHGLGDLGRVGTALDLEGISGRGLEQGVDLLAPERLERAGRAWDDGVQLQGRPSRARKKFFSMLTGDGALGSGRDGSSDGRASSLGDHLRGHAGGEDTSGGHCDGRVRALDLVSEWAKDGRCGRAGVSKAVWEEERKEGAQAGEGKRVLHRGGRMGSGGTFEPGHQQHVRMWIFPRQKKGQGADSTGEANIARAGSRLGGNRVDSLREQALGNAALTDDSSGVEHESWTGLGRKLTVQALQVSATFQRGFPRPVMRRRGCDWFRGPLGGSAPRPEQLK